MDFCIPPSTGAWAARVLVAATVVSPACASAAASRPAGTDGVEPHQLTAQAVAYEHGEGVSRDYAKAATLYCRAALRGDAQAQFNLGWMYANGRGLPRDDGMAASLFAMAAKQGDEQARRMLQYVGEPTEQVPDCMKPPPAATVADDGDDSMMADSPQRRRVVELVRKLAPEYNISPRLALAVINVESNYSATARSPKNAQGLMQLIPETSARFNVRNAYDPVQNVRGGLAYLRWLLAYFKGNVALVAAGYNAGEKAVDRYRGIPPYRETQNYVKKILELFKGEEHPYDASVTEPSPEIQRITLSRTGRR